MTQAAWAAGNTISDFAAMLEREAIRAQVDEYIDALNHRDWVRFGATLCEDLVWSAGAPFDASVTGRDAMLQLVKEHQESVYAFVFQMNHGVVVEDLDGDFARVRHTMQERSERFMTVGLYYDIMRKEADGVWRFARRDFRSTYFETANAPGEIYRRLPAV